MQPGLTSQQQHDYVERNHGKVAITDRILGAPGAQAQAA